MKSIEEQLATYKSVHLNQKNIKTHFIGIPLIILAATLMLSTIAFEFTVHFDIAQDSFLTSPITLHITLAMLIFSVVALYYIFLHRLLAVGMVLYILINLFIAQLLSDTEGVLYIGLGLFVIGWIIQFIGHYYEKAKPAFIDDLSQFLIGPLFLMAEVYFMLGLVPVLNAQVTTLAVEKRKQLEKRNSLDK